MSMAEWPEPGGPVAPHVAVKTHLDGDPSPRPEEVAEWDAIRRRYDLDEMIALILVPDESQTGMPFPGHQTHSWVIEPGEAGGVRCRRFEVTIKVVPEDSG